MFSKELLCDDDNINLHKIWRENTNDSDSDEYLFSFTCKENLEECDIIDIIKNNQLFELIYNLNNNIITEFKNINENVFLVKIKEIDVSDTASQDENSKKHLFLCLNENISIENENKLSVNYTNFKYEHENLKQVEIDSFNVNCERIENNININVNVTIKIDIYDLSIIDNDAIMIILKIFFKNLKKYIEPV